jgi:hypothetical protein
MPFAADALSPASRAFGLNLSNAHTSLRKEQSELKTVRIRVDNHGFSLL